MKVVDIEIRLHHITNMHKSKHISSFDIFDTCFVRACGTPDNFFDVLAFRVFNCDVDANTRNAFIIARRKTERELYKEDPHTDIYNIYKNLTFEHPQLFDKDKLPEIEMLLEKEMIRPVLLTRDKVNKARAKGHLIVFISDMYLHSDFLIPLLAQYGFYKQNDKVYISAEMGACKYGGGLYKLIQNDLGIPFKKWTHYGDNDGCDYDAAREFGIHAKRVVLGYQPYPQKWNDEECSLYYKHASIAAGISRAIYHSEPNNTHKNFILDLIAPFSCSYVYRVMKDANERGINRLFFCARDAHHLYNIATQLSSLFPHIELHYIQISRDALLKSNQQDLIKYFIQEGLASKNINTAIVDSTTSGKTTMLINDLLKNNEFNTIFSYYYLYWDDDGRNILIDPSYFKFEIQQSRALLNKQYYSLFKLVNNCIFESFFSLNTESHTESIIKQGEKYVPKYDQGNYEDSFVDEADKWMKIHDELIAKYTNNFIITKLYLYSDNLFETALKTLLSFFRFPEKEYLPALLSFKAFFSDKPVIKECSTVHLLLHRGKDSVWPLATIIYNLPHIFRSLMMTKFRKKNIY